MMNPNKKTIEERLDQLKDKYDAMGQDMESYLEGLLYSNPLDYWDYIETDILLGLQRPRTPIPDEEIFILYHQITELYFKLILKALKEITDCKEIESQFFIKFLKRINSYYRHIISSFEIMIDGMEIDQFLKFRMALLPSSGFQSAQYRLIEFACTKMENLVAFNQRDQISEDKSPEDYLEYVYWKQGATELITKKKTLTLRKFEEKYKGRFVRFINKVEFSNLHYIYEHLPTKEKSNEELILQLRELDLNANVRWPMMHLKAAANYLKTKNSSVEATGGTNWKKYLPPKRQRISFFPELFTEKEQSTWGEWN